MRVYVYVGKRALASFYSPVCKLYSYTFILKNEKTLEGCDVEHMLHTR
jgi:hypothetical protein